MKWHRHMLPALFAAACATQSADTLVIQTEKGDSPTGPWIAIQPAQNSRDTNGNPILPAGLRQEFFRARIDRVPGDPTFDAVPLANLPKDVLKTAEEGIVQFTSPAGTNGLPMDPELWFGVKLAPQARPIYEPTILGGSAPAYWEFKVIASQAVPVRSKGGFIDTQPRSNDTDRGYMVVSATQDDFPIVEFATEGRSPLDRLAERAGTASFKVNRFGGAFYTAEDAAGNVLAQHGTEPFQPRDVALADLTKVITFTGDDELEQTNRMPFPKMLATNADSYRQFKADYRQNPVFQHLLNRRLSRARTHWGIEQGRTAFRQAIVRVGATISETNRSDIRGVRLLSENPELARVTVNVANRSVFTITGAQAGTGEIEVTDGAGKHYLTLSVTPSVRPSAANFVPGWRSKVTAYAGTWDMQPKFYQLSRDEFCPYVGCGPVAWGMLFAWFEVNKGIPAAFGDWFSMDATLTMNNNNNSHIGVWRALHELCDVMCFATTDAGATWPGDMFDGALDYTSFPVLAKLLYRKYHMEYDLTESGLAEHGLLCRDAIKKGYPSVVGLGWLWHYALAYGYKYQEFEAAPGVYIGSRRILKCNMGWGPNEAPRWYDLNDTFFGADFKVSKGPLSP
jgi:hypothetical protein